MAQKLQIRRGTAAEWTTANPVLSEGEIAIELDTQKIKVGDGVKNWSLLPYVKIDISSVIGLQAALDNKSASLHTHGNITNAGAIGTTTGVPVITGTNGVLQAGSFGTTAGTYCQGNDSRLSDARTPTDWSVTNDKVSITAAIADTKLATISTANKVANSATTATNASTANAIVARDGSGDFSAGTITANLTGDVTGNAATATTLQTARTINGVSFNGSANITVTAAPDSHTHDDRYYTETEMNTLLDGKQASGSYASATHQHAISDTTGLQTALDGKQASGSYAAATHTHDDRYYTETEVNNLLAGKQFICQFTSDIDANTNRPAGSYGSYASSATNTPTGSGILHNFTSGTDGSGDGAQIWQEYVTNRLWARQRWGGNWTAWAEISLAGHTHDDRYYTETEMNTLLDGKQASGSYVVTTDARLSDARTPTSHNHDASNIISGTLANDRLPARLGATAQSISDWNAALENGWYQGNQAANAPEGVLDWWIGQVETHNGAWVTQTIYRFTADAPTNTQIWRRSSSDNGAGGRTWGAWYKLQLSQAEQDARYQASGSYVVTTDARLSDARTPTAHTHDDRYYTETETDTLLASKSATTHTHDERYYTETETNTLLASKSATTHTHTTLNSTFKILNTGAAAPNYPTVAKFNPTNSEGTSGGTVEVLNSLIVGKADGAIGPGEPSVTAYWTDDPPTYVQMKAEDGTAGTANIFHYRKENVVMVALRANGSIYSKTLHGSTASAISVDANGVIVRGSSDERLKENIATIEGALSKVNQMRGVYYYWKDKESMGSSKCVGLIAQEVKKVIPEAVYENPDGHYGVHYAELVGLLINAVNELKQEVNELRTKLA